MKTILALAAGFFLLIFYWWAPLSSTGEGGGSSRNSGTSIAHASIADGVTRTLSRQREIFASIIEGFEEEGRELETTLEEGKGSLLNFRSMIREARNHDPEFNQVYRTWERVAGKTTDLKRKFNELIEGAAEFYATAEDHAQTIHDEALRTESLNYIGESRSSYLTRLEATKAAINQVDTMKVAVDDTMKALEIRFAVDIVDRRIAEMFEQIDQMMEDVLRALRELELESQQVLRQFV